MGICSGSSKKNEDSIHKINQPPITQGILQIQVLLKNIKLNMPEVKQCSIEFDLGQCKYTSPNHINIDGEHFWRASYDSKLTITEEQMRQTNIKISVLGPQTIGTAAINLFEAAVGPFHFQLPIKGEQSGNVTFDLKMNQVIQASLKSNYIGWQLNSSISDVGYNYNLRLVTSQFSFISEHSGNYINPNYRRQNERQKSVFQGSRKSIIESDGLKDSIISFAKSPYQVGNNSSGGIAQNSSGGIVQSSSGGIHQNSFSIPLQSSPDQVVSNSATPTNKGASNISAYHRIDWDHQNADEGEELSMIVELPLSEFLNSAIQLCLWSVKSMPKSFKNESNIKSPFKTQVKKKVMNRHDSEYLDLEIQDHHLVAETYISLQHLETSISADIGEYQFLSIQTDSLKPIWYHGVEVGKIEFKINVQLPKYLQQSSFGVQTDKGIISQLSVVGQVDNISVTEIKHIQTEFQRLSSIIFKIEHKSQSVEEKVKTRNDLEQNLNKLASLLQQSHNQGMIAFQYKSEDDLMKAQSLLVQISTHLVEYDQTLSSINNYYDCLNALLSRGELMLQQLGFFKQLNKKQTQLKTEIGLNYQSFLIQTLKHTLNKLNQKDPSILARQFYIKFLVVSYFRIPQFRAKFLELISKSTDPQLNELRGTEFIQEDDPSNIDKSTKSNITIFDWQNYFHTYLQDQSKGIQNQSTLNQILDDESWKEQVRHRSVNFCFFVEEWAKYVKAILGVKILPWQDTPGYRTLVKAFMCELKQQESITDAMKIALQSLLANVNLLGVVINLQFNKTNLYNPEQVIETFEILDVCFSTLTQMPPYFDYPFFLKGIKQIIVDSEHAMCIAKCMWLIYNMYPLFSVEFKKDLCEFVFEKAVFKLFLHWSKTVRLVFHYFLLYRVSHLHKNAKMNNLDEENIMQQYTLINRPKKNQSYFDNRQPQQQLISDYIYVKYLRFLGKVEQAKLNENQREFEGDHKSLYYAMVNKKLKRQRESKLNQEEPPLEALKLEKLQSETDEINNHTLKAVVVPRPVMHKKLSYKHDLVIDEKQKKYVNISIREFEEQMKNYNNWRQHNIKNRMGTYTDEEKHTIHLTFQVPKVDILKRIDEKEGA